MKDFRRPNKSLQACLTCNYFINWLITMIGSIDWSLVATTSNTERSKFIAFCVLGLTISTEVLFGTANFKVSQFVFSATIFTYNFQRIVRIKKGLKHMQKSWLENQNIAIYLLMAYGGIVSAYRFFEFQLLTQ